MGDPSRYAYPEDLARFACERWPGTPPACDVLERLYSTCYQASHLTDEGRPVTFRAILADPGSFPAQAESVRDLHRLEFARSRPFDARELRRLSVAADFSRSLIAATADAGGDLSVWGLVHQGPRWLHDVVGGRGGGPALPPVPVVHVLAPGSLEARRGLEVVGRLESGRLSGTRFDVFESRWLPRAFQSLQDEQRGVHARGREHAEATGAGWAPLDPDLPRRIGERMTKRVVALLRRERHGGTIVHVPFEVADDLGDGNPYLDIKYRFAEAEARRRFFDVTVGILNRLSMLHGERGRPVAWPDFEATTDDDLAALDEALFELAYLIAGLAAVDGAVVLDTHLQLLGFGAEISGRLPDVAVIGRALDLEGKSVAGEPAANEGTRHRSAYRLVAALPGSVAIVVSQDGGVRFLAARDGRVTYWEHE